MIENMDSLHEVDKTSSIISNKKQLMSAVQAKKVYNGNIKSDSNGRNTYKLEQKYEKCELVPFCFYIKGFA